MLNHQQEVRDGWAKPCPQCGETIKYTLLTVWNVPTPFFYCNTCNDVLYRKSDERRVPPGDLSDPQYIAALLPLWESIANTTPPCSCGGRFELWSNVKCPHCKYEFPYNQGVKDPGVRIRDTKVVVIDGATIVGGDAKDTWLMRVEVPAQGGKT